MYGKIFESLFNGSMVGSGCPVFAVWSYVIAKMRSDPVVGAQVDLNPVVLACILGDKETVIVEAIEKLCAPDPRSTSKKEGGRRLIRLGEFAYQVVNGADYMNIRSEDDRREYFRLKKQQQRAAKKALRHRPLLRETAMEHAEAVGSREAMEAVQAEEDRHADEVVRREQAARAEELNRIAALRDSEFGKE